MARFSLGGEDDGEGPSRRIPKRQRTNLSSTIQPPPPPQKEEPLEEREDEQEIDEEGDDDDDEGGGGEEDRNEGQGTIIPGQASEADGSDKSKVGDSVAPNGDGFMSVTLTDPDVLDCPICVEPLSIPVFQCENGHIACSSCCIKVGNKCPSCSWPIGYNRCRAIEKVLESVKILCRNMKYGCKETVSYSKKHEHEETCIYTPCSCPLLGCDFVGSCKNLYQHFGIKHANSSVRFWYDCLFSVSLEICQKYAILQERTEGVIFILNHDTGNLGSVVNVDCIAQSSLKSEFSYDLMARKGDSSVRLQSFTQSISKRVERIPEKQFLVVPNDFISDRKLRLDLCIRRQRNNLPF